MSHERKHYLTTALKLQRGELFMECHTSSPRERQKKMMKTAVKKAARKIGRATAFTVQETAELLRVKKGTVYREIASERLCAQKCGKAYRIHRDSYERYLKPWDDPQSLPEPGWPRNPNAGSCSTGASRSPSGCAVEKAKRLLKKQ